MSSRRTNTTRQAIFELAFLQQATFDFSDATNIRVAVPKGSQWYIPLHWHPNSLGCTSVSCRDGRLHVYVAGPGRGSYDKIGGSGMGVKFQRGQRVSWLCGKLDNTRKSLEPWTVDFAGDQALHRNICSAILDANRLGNLASTPLWLRMFLAFPAPRRWLEPRLLYVQLQMMYYAHDFHIYHGRINFTWPWFMQPFGARPPYWAYNLQLQSQFLISRMVMGFYYWIGRLFLGMKAEYDEYTPIARNKKWC